MMFVRLAQRLLRIGIWQGGAGLPGRPVPGPALLLAAGLCLATPVAAQDTDLLVVWKTEAVRQDDANAALSQFYAAIYNAGQLATKEVEVKDGDTPTDVMRREGSWPAYLGSSNRLLDAVICDLNQRTCSRDFVTASGSILNDLSLNVAATEPTEGNWKGLQAGAMLRIPDYVVEMHYETIVTSPAYLERKFGKEARIEPTGDFGALYCNLHRSACPRQPALTWDGTGRPPILLFDPRRFGMVPDDVALPKGVLDDFMGANARRVLAAVPILSLRQTVTLPSKGNVARIGLDDLQRSMPRNVMISQQLRLETAVVVQDLNRVFFDRMALDPTSIDPQIEPAGVPVTVYHFDRQARLQHCMFQQNTGVQLYEWRPDNAGGPGMPVEVQPTGTAADCTPVEAVASASRDHGTHTLGLLVGQLEAFALGLPPSDVPYFNVVHVPLSGSVFEVESGTGDAAQIESVLSSMALVWPKPDVVSMSLSWPADELGLLDEQILLAEDLITFVVAAPQQEALNECARGPAGIKDLDGDFARNVISVVGLNLAGTSDQQTVVVLDGAGTGSNCHEIGAFGELLGPIGETNGVGRLAGSSQATPVVAATVAELIRRMPDDRPSPLRIGFRLVSTGWFSPDIINRAKATLLDSRNALTTMEDVIVTETGCRVLGQFVSIKNAAKTTRDNYIYLLEDGTPRFIKAAEHLLSFRHLDEARVIVVHLLGEEIVVEVGRRQKRAMDAKFIQFAPDRVDARQGPCDAVDMQSQWIPAAIVDQLIIRKLGG